MSRMNGSATPGAVSSLALALATAVVVFSIHRYIVRGEAETAADVTDRAGVERDRSSEASRRPPASGSSSHEDAVADESLPTSEDTRESDAPLTLDTPETFRNTSILIAIREAGFVCPDLVSAAAGTDDVAAWRVVCDGALVYLVGVDESGRLAVDPVPYAEGYRYFDPDAPPLWLDQQQPPRRLLERQPFQPR
jgi:hypothetical protein